MIPKQGKCFPERPNANETFPRQGPPNTPGDLHGVRGFSASVRATTDRTLVNYNACVGAIYKESHLDDLFCIFLSCQYPSVKEYKRLESAIQGLRAELLHLVDGDHKSMRTTFGLALPYAGPGRVGFHDKDDERTYTVAGY